MSDEAQKVIAELDKKNAEAHERLSARCNEMAKQLAECAKQTGESAKTIRVLTDLLKTVLLCHRTKKFADAEKALTNYFGPKGGMN